MEFKTERFELRAHGGRVFREPDLKRNFAIADIGARSNVLMHALERGEDSGLELALKELALFGEGRSRRECGNLFMKSGSWLCLSGRRRRWPWRWDRGSQG